MDVEKLGIEGIEEEGIKKGAVLRKGITCLEKKSRLVTK